MKALLETLKGKSREERKVYFEELKTELLDAALESVNGGRVLAAAESGENPDSDCPYEGNWVSSFGFVCRGEVVC